MLGAFRLVATAYAILLATQPIWIGMFLQGSFDKLGVHRTVGGIAIGLSWLIVLVAGALWWPGRIAKWPLFGAIGLLVSLIVMFVLGSSRVVAIHVPLGVLIVSLAAALAIWSWLPVTRRKLDAA